MLLLLRLSIFLAAFKGCLPAGLPQLQNNNGQAQAANRQVGGGGISFAIPGLSLLAGNNAGLGGGGLFGTVTFTRTVVSTVSTVTTASFRTCTSTMANIPACAAGRRKREAEEPELIEIQATPTVQLVIGATTISDPAAVTEYLEAHKPSSQSIIYPKDFNGEIPVKLSPGYEMSIGETTVLYPSQDTPETTESDNINEFDDIPAITTETPSFQDEYLNDETYGSGTTPAQGTERVSIGDDGLEEFGVEKGRVGFGKTSTVTTVIRVTSVATTLATGAMATLQVHYSGCLPQSLPVSGVPLC